MYVFKSMADLAKVPLNHPCRNFVLKIVRLMIMDGLGYDPEADGYAVLLEPQDLTLSALLPEVSLPLCRMPWEGVIREQGLYHGVVLTNNQFAIDIVIPDAEWLTSDIRESLEAHL